MTQEPMGLYLHIPFCKAKCPYCDFYSLPAEESMMERYTASLIIAMEHSGVAGPFDTLYFGGGTPNLLGAHRLNQLIEGAFSHFSWGENAEITLEANPGSLSYDELISLRQSGFNRLSIGVQSLWEHELSLLGRLHSPANALRAIDSASRAGFGHISCDLIIGLPGQDMRHIAHSVKALTETAADHISVYMLKIEPDTPFFTRYMEPDGDMQADLYLATVELLGSEGFRQYEISNFARGGGESRHNLKYWRLVPYLGLGPSAHSFINGERRYFPRDIRGFMAAENPLSLWQSDGEGGGADEYVMLSLRLSEGAELSVLEQLFPGGKITEKLRPLINDGLVRVEGGRLSLTPRGFLLSNRIIAHLLS